MKAKKFLVKVMVIFIVVLVFCGVHLLVNKLTGPKDIKLSIGWQLVQINGVIPKGTVLIVSSESNAVLPNQNPETKQATGFINQGRVNFYKSTWVMTKTKIWVYLPSDDYEFLTKKNDFVAQCQQKLSDLTEGKDILVDEYDVGH